MSSTGRDFRHLTPLVLMAALQRAGTQVCEPIDRFRVELPADTLGAVQAALVRLGGVPESQDRLDASYLLLEGDIPAARVHELRQLLPGLTGGEGVLDCGFDRYEPVRGAAPRRPRTDNNPLDRKAYLLLVRP
jgi:ribosomal protection tetracycline resistance protein